MARGDLDCGGTSGQPAQAELGSSSSSGSSSGLALGPLSHLKHAKCNAQVTRRQRGDTTSTLATRRAVPPEGSQGETPDYSLATWSCPIHLVWATKSQELTVDLMPHDF